MPGVPQLLLAVDPSLRVSGWVLFSLADGNPIRAGIITPPGTEMLLARRYDVLQQLIHELFVELNLGEGDCLVCEGPAPLVLDPENAAKVERVRGIFEALARARGVVVPGRINPRTVQTDLLGMRGKQLARKEVKAWAKEVAGRLYGETLGMLAADSFGQDIIDAALLGTVAVTRVQLATKSGISWYEAFSPRAKGRNGTSATRTSRKSQVRWSERELRLVQKGSRRGDSP